MVEASNKRIEPLDGLRVIAALGIVWIHSWNFANNPSLKIAGVDLYRSVAIVGNGVDFFFVISGFFMFIMFSGRLFNWNSYSSFIARRWKRIAPAFYVSAVVYSVIFFCTEDHYNIVKKLGINFLFLNNCFPSSEIIGPYWSLGTEWHFYLILPLLFITARGFFPGLLIASLLSIVFLSLITFGVLDKVFWLPQIFPRFIEFGFGILAAYLYKNKVSLPGIFSKKRCIPVAIILTYYGRIFLTTEVFQYGITGKLLNIAGLPLMTFGFAWLCYLLITTSSWLSKFLSLGFMQYLGKISYSIYLWHSLLFVLLGGWLRSFAGRYWETPLIFLVISAGTIVISHFSYRFLEAPYFKHAALLKNKEQGK